MRSIVVSERLHGDVDVGDDRADFLSRDRPALRFYARRNSVPPKCAHSWRSRQRDDALRLRTLCLEPLGQTGKESLVNVRMRGNGEESVTQKL